MKRILIILAMVCQAIWCGTAAQGALGNPSVKFYEGNLSYKQGNYEKAIATYEEVLKEGFASGALYYNLGNSYFKAQQLGKAILSYERAKLFIPRDSDVQSNLNYAMSRSRASSTPQEISFLKKIFDDYKDLLTSREMMWIVVILYILIGVALVCAEIFQLSTRTRWLLVIFLASVTVAQGFLWISNVQNISRAVVVLEDAQAKFEPSDQATQHFYLFAGEKVFVLRSEGAWAKIQRLDGKLGWVKVSDVERLISEQR